MPNRPPLLGPEVYMGTAVFFVQKHYVVLEDKRHHMLKLEYHEDAAYKEATEGRELFHVLYFNFLVVELNGIVL